MQDWKTLLALRSFRRFWLALICFDLCTWCVVATLPILVAARFGAGTELVISLGVAASGLHAEGLVSLSAYWAGLSLFSTVPLVPLITTHLRAGRVVPQTRAC